MSDMPTRHAMAKEKFFKELSILLQDAEWSESLFSLIETGCGFLPGYRHVLFPDGFAQIIEEFEFWQDQRMMEVTSEEEAPAKIREKIQRALEVRITNVVPKGVILKQNALFLLPSHLLTAAKCYGRSCDLIWRLAGDRSDDFNYYSKRGLLLGVYTAARLFYLSDESPSFILTKEFIATSLNRIINIASFGKKVKLPKMEDVPILRLFS